MTMLPRTQVAPMALGMVSLVLGTIALLLFFMPILGIPISAIGLLCGIGGIIGRFIRVELSLRWSLAGGVVCSLALGVNLAIAYAPRGYLPPPRVAPSWQTVPD